MYNPMREIKLCLLGDSGVGKSSLVLRFVSDQFQMHPTATIGASFMSKTLKVDENVYKYQIWDTAGQCKYRSLAPMYYRGAAAAIVVYDLTMESTFESVKTWISELQTHGPPNIVIAIAGNKNDLVDLREVTVQQGRDYAEEINAVFAETSALTADNVSYIFEEIAKRLPSNEEHYNVTRGSTLKLKEENKEKSCCDS